LAFDSFKEVGPGNHFFGCQHTLDNYETAFWESELNDNDAYEMWTDNGSEDMAVRANRRWKQQLVDYQSPELDESIDEALLEFIDKKKGSMEDQWY
jgi:trimethylamine--corrinoid protein Co-methyltransferase